MSGIPIPIANSFLLNCSASDLSQCVLLNCSFSGVNHSLLLNCSSSGLSHNASLNCSSSGLCRSSQTLDRLGREEREQFQQIGPSKLLGRTNCGISCTAFRGTTFKVFLVDLCHQFLQYFILYQL